MRGLLVVTLALASAVPAMAQQGAGGSARAGAAFQCPGCDSAQLVAARRRWVDAEISKLTLELARNRILIENLVTRLAPDSPEPPRNERERAELKARLDAQQREMSRMLAELSARCGEQEPLRGHVGVSLEQSMDTQVSGGGRSTTTLNHPVVLSVQPGSPAARVGLMPGDTIVAINGADARMRSLAPYVREPGTRLTLTIGREGGRRDVSLVVAQRPATFDGACIQYRDVRFTDPAGQNLVMFRSAGPTVAGAQGGTVRAGAAGSGRSGAVRTRVNTTAEGQSSVHVVLSPDSTTNSTFIMIPPVSAGNALFLSRGGTGAVVAGAEVSLVNGGLKTIFAVDYGALVLNVAARSPAEQAGILSGDVIVRANGEAVTAVAVLQRAIQTAEKRNVTLDVIRAKQSKQITLRW